MGTLDEPTALESIADDEEKGKFKSAELTQATTFPYVIWSPPVGKKVVIDDIVLSLWERSNSRAIFDLEIRKDSTWTKIARVGIVNNGVANVTHAFVGRLATDKNNSGPGNRIRITQPTGSNTTQFNLVVVVTGKLK